MTPRLASAAMPLLRALDAETAHRAALCALRAGLAGADRRPDPPVLAARLFGRALSNPVGLAAGFDKDALALVPLFRLGFGLVEAGTATPRPQAGNPRPRLFRLPEDRAVINRMGMNNRGIAAFAARLSALPRPLPGLLGANVGINKDGADPERDYPDLYEAVAPHADYVALNLSSPNTPGLRDLQAEARMAAILSAVAERRARLPRRPPVAVKIAPDLAPEALAPIVETCIAHGVAALIVSNSTIARDPSLRSAARGEPGGLSGRPLFAPSTDLLRRSHALARGRLELIGCGGVEDGATAYAKLRAGASAVQLYSALAYEGPALLRRIKDELAALLARDGFATAADAVGADLR
ncbi:MAG: quinone-dependent dihydroorotate dehydrogenase [Acetobacteraceae bacterium]|nr:quinone-dependent dihydroorotate dehydrogenase [Acetobacteraceae bacterium]